MAEQDESKPQVVVVVPHAAGPQKERHPGGTYIQIQDAHLIIQASTSDRDVLAIYTPGKWIKATVVRQ